MKFLVYEISYDDRDKTLCFNRDRLESFGQLIKLGLTDEIHPSSFFEEEQLPIEFEIEIKDENDVQEKIDEYFKNIIKHNPSSYRVRQLS